MAAAYPSRQILAVAAAIVAVAVLLAAPGHGQTTRPPGAKKETIEADISTRNVAVGTDFSGTRVVIFGTVTNSRQEALADNLYDIAAVIVGPSEQLVARRKSNVAGLWINTRSYRFDNVPSYYTVLSTRPLKEIAPRPMLFQLGIGFDNVRVVPKEAGAAKETDDFRDGVLRVKAQQGLYREEPRGLTFIGGSLFRGSVDLPANVSVGQFTAWIYLFEKGELITSYKTTIDLQREGFERTVHNFAMQQPFLYGVTAIAMALVAGFVATLAFRRD